MYGQLDWVCLIGPNPLALREHAQRFRRQRDGQLLPLGDGEIPHQIGGKIGEDRDPGRRLGFEPRAAERAEEIEQRDARRDLVRRGGVDVAHAHFLRPQPDPHRGAVLETVDAVAGKLDRSEAQRLWRDRDAVSSVRG